VVDLALLQKGVHGSGFPFELRLATALIKLGYEVRPSLYFLDRDRQKDAEIDLIATKHFHFSSTSEPEISATLRVAFECKDTANTFVCFGLPSQRLDDTENVSIDVLTPHFRTSRDKKMTGRFNIILFHPRGDESPRIIDHHHYQGAVRYHSVAIAETHGHGNQQYYRVSSPDTLRHALAKLGSYVGLNDEHEAPDRLMEELAHGPSINALFSALVHPGQHYRYSLSDELPEAASHTSVFLSRSYFGSSLHYVVDLISAEGLSEAMCRLEASFSAIVTRVVPYMLQDQSPNDRSRLSLR